MLESVVHSRCLRRWRRLTAHFAGALAMLPVLFAGPTAGLPLCVGSDATCCCAGKASGATRCCGHCRTHAEKGAASPLSRGSCCGKKGTVRAIVAKAAPKAKSPCCGARKVEPGTQSAETKRPGASALPSAAHNVLVVAEVHSRTTANVTGCCCGSFPPASPTSPLAPKVEGGRDGLKAVSLCVVLAEQPDLCAHSPATPPDEMPARPPLRLLFCSLTI